MRSLSSFAVISLILLLAAAYLLNQSRPTAPGGLQTFPNPKDVFMERPPSESVLGKWPSLK